MGKYSVGLKIMFFRCEKSQLIRKKFLKMKKFAEFDICVNLPFFQEFRYLNPSVSIFWPKGAPPVAEPKCGFNGEKCIHALNWRLILLGCFSSIVVLVGFALILR